jgi:phosphoadenosine phosphosulfate reductase
MSVHDVRLFGDQVAASRLEARFSAVRATSLLRLAIEDLFAGKIALVSSFGADSAVLLDMVAGIDPSTPVVFIDTGQLFPETLAYRDALVARFGLTDVRSILPQAQVLAAEDPEGFLFTSDPDRCCEIRKVEPLAVALDGFDAWITGRKRFQSATRSALSLFEAEGDRVKINPLAGWSASDVIDYLHRREIPPHPLVAKGFPSIGCLPCTSRVAPGEDPRAGRWRGRGKVECGIHAPTLDAGSDI